MTTDGRVESLNQVSGNDHLVPSPLVDCNTCIYTEDCAEKNKVNYGEDCEYYEPIKPNE